MCQCIFVAERQKPSRSSTGLSLHCLYYTELHVNPGNVTGRTSLPSHILSTNGLNIRLEFKVYS